MISENKFTFWLSMWRIERIDDKIVHNHMIIWIDAQFNEKRCIWFTNVHILFKKAERFPEPQIIHIVDSFLIKVCAVILCTSFNLQILIISTSVCYSTHGSQLSVRSSAKPWLKGSSRKCRRWWWFQEQEVNLSYPERLHARPSSAPNKNSRETKELGLTGVYI